MESNCIQEKMDKAYRAFIIKFEMTLSRRAVEHFRFWCRGTLSESQLEGRSVVDIVSGLERADKLSCHNLGFLKNFLKDRKSLVKLYKELLQAEANINCFQTMMEYTKLESKHQAYNSQTHPFRVAQVLLQMNEHNDKLSKIINKITTSEAYKEIYETLSKEMSDLLCKEDDVTWEKVQLLFAGCCKLEGVVHDSPDFNEKWRSELRLLLSTLIARLGGWDEFVQNVKNQSSEVTEPDDVMRKEFLDAVYNGNILMEKLQKSSVDTSQSVPQRTCVYKNKPYALITTTSFFQRRFPFCQLMQRVLLLFLRHD